ncbi:protein FLUORESCENT IN BLUE LIGHT, chloroplastic isoform X2 [Solanum lycopersicum]|uniref:protein FLUORESCENT IN BLUE LIGHT, chloroplastic isoform X2 n=1 Tax=Solanum lycopersicum TaxID=4081 RepID=UPI0002766533|nr:protein FLUORESCENT IN BLUE LIGHT, chloroplastic isoform X2 [Solanum lycopersicum]
MAIMMKQGLLWSPCPHSISPKIQSFKQPIFQLTNKWRKEGEAMLINSVTQEKSKKKGIAIDFKFRNSAATIIVANALMMTSPLDALAETCEVDNSPFNMLFNMPILLLVALIGATVGGLVARQRKAELQRLNEQLRQINAALRRQAKIESYAPNLSYAPAGGRVAETEVIVDPRKEELISRLKNGKKFLRNQAPDKAQLEFKAALDLAQNLKEPLREKKAARGLGASLQRQGNYREAIKYHSLVLELSARYGEDSGSTEAYGAIADCYTELGDLEQAAKYYDQYIARLETD